MMNMDNEAKLNIQETKPKMTVFAGTNGAGKSTITKTLASLVGEVIDPDAIAKRLSPDKPEAVAVAAGREALQRVQACIDQRRNFSIETTLAGGNVIRQMQQAKEAGFEVNMYYVALQDVGFHIDRVASRVNAGGHFIPTEDILRRYDRSLENVPKAIPHADRVFVFDNTEKFEWMLDVKQGLIQLHTSQIPNWLDRILKGWDKEQEKMLRDLERNKDRTEDEYEDVQTKLLREKEKLKPVQEMERLKNQRDHLEAKLMELKPKSLLEKIASRQALEGVQRDVRQLDAKIEQLEKRVPSSAEIQVIQQNLAGLGTHLSALQEALRQVGQALLSGQTHRQYNQLQRQFGTAQEYVREQEPDLER